MISAFLITLNEEENLTKALQSLEGVADEVIVVDSGSTDKTLEIAKDFGAKVYYRKFDNFSNQRNWAVSKTTGDWILSIDADEEIPYDLVNEIKEAVKGDYYMGYLMPRRNFILGREIKYSRWSPDKHIWLWKKGFGKYSGDVHEEVLINGKVGSLKKSKIHNSHKNVSEFIEANNKYSQLEAYSLFKKKKQFHFWKMMWEPFFEFFIRFIYKRGFLDGSKGFILAYLMGIYKLMVWIKLWDLNTKKE